jgi:class 3 adenylate cyclase
MTTHIWKTGVKGRLLLSFLGIMAFAILGAAGALLALAEVGSLFDRVTRERVPASFAALELSRHAERITAAAPVIFADRTLQQQMQTDRMLRNQLGELDRLFREVKEALPDDKALRAIEDSVNLIRQNLAQLQVIMAIHPHLKSGPDRLFVEGDELIRAGKLLQTNKDISARLTTAVNSFVEDQRREIDRSSAEVAEKRRNSTILLIGTVCLGLISSVLIVWLYVGRNIITRLNALKNSMLAIASGDLKSSLPASGDNDEIEEMAKALRIFRDTAIENERLGRLKRFLAPQVAELIVSSGDESVLDSHRRDVAVLFCDLRGFTTFAEAAEPEEVMELLREYHACLGSLVRKFAGTLERYTGDGLIVLFNDPLRCEEPCLTATRLALEMRKGVREILERRPHLNSQLGFGIGIAYGYATLGRVGFEDRFDYTAIGSVVNLAARLCERAKPEEILIDGKVQSAIKDRIPTVALGDTLPKGFTRPVQVFNVPAQTIAA